MSGDEIDDRSAYFQGVLRRTWFSFLSKYVRSAYGTVSNLDRARSGPRARAREEAREGLKQAA